jgi:hypothetical protein
VSHRKETDMMSRIRRFRSAPICASLLAALWLAGCASQESATESNEAAEPAAEAAAPAAPSTAPSEQAPEVLFTNVEDGGTYVSPVEVIFGTNNFDIVPVQDPPVINPGEGHYHLAVDVDCVTAGEIIPPGTPSYIHFGDGSDRISLQLEPGEHRLCLQIADGEHRVFDGPEAGLLTKEITITVEAGS